MSELPRLKRIASDIPVLEPVDTVITVAPIDDVVLVQPLEPRAPLVIPVARVTLPGRLWGAIRSFSGWIFGALTLTIGLSVLAAIPIVQFLTLGYLLEASGRIARSGRLRSGFVGVRRAARLGGIVLGTALVLFPLKNPFGLDMASLTADAQLIDPEGPLARGWRAALTILSVLAVVHILAAVSRGGRLRWFFWPFNFLWLIRQWWRGGWYAESRDATLDFLAALRLPYYFWLGARGFAGAMLWLVIPITLLALGSKAGPLVGLLRPNIQDPKVVTGLDGLAALFGFLSGLFGAGLLVLVLLYLPFLQTHYAAENRFRACFEIGEVRQRFRRAPWLFAFALFLTLLFALPLYLLKIEIVPREAAWLPGLVFLIFIFPARLMTGWAYGLGNRRPLPRHWFFRWTGRLMMLPVAALYVLIVFFTQYAAWGGVWSLYEQHAFLLPVPFAGM